MRVLVFGGSGQLARALGEKLPGALRLGRRQVDISVPGSSAAAITDAAPNLVINAAAYTAVDKAETDCEQAFSVNAEAPGEMARACAAAAIPLLHVSTDYVFDGSGERPWRPDDVTSPLNVYGASKLAGERNLLAAGGQFVILRTSWIFSRYGHNFLKAMLFQKGDSVEIVADQFGAPTPAAAIADALIEIGASLLRDSSVASGIYHFAAAPDCSWAEFARFIFACAGRQVEVHEISSAERNGTARRPANSRLDCQSTLDRFGLARPDWRQAAHQTIRQILGDADES